jgi:hypothetical protein
MDRLEGKYTLMIDFCLEVVEEVIDRYGLPENFN